MLREPSMRELLNFLESAVGELVSEYSNKIDELDKMIPRLIDSGLAITDFKLLEPAFKPICNFIAMVNDGEESIEAEWIYQHITPAQFIACINKLMYLLDIEELYTNFSDALARVIKIQKKAGNLSAH